ncbi:hypothetical protein VKT23_013909 [Stygiomarasmius scandens]|uniref:Uncharacterized protein n=1 Tax=Marasmiellus scandens TaxID=2682957 RepID=A0ABR1J2Q1_9AGAR
MPSPDMPMSLQDDGDTLYPYLKSDTLSNSTGIQQDNDRRIGSQILVKGLWRGSIVKQVSSQ